jgi:hypothetical protein
VQQSSSSQQQWSRSNSACKLSPATADETPLLLGKTFKMLIVNLDEGGKVMISGERQCLLKILPELENTTTTTSASTTLDESSSTEEHKYLNRVSLDLNLVEVMERVYGNEFVLEACHTNEYIFVSNKSNKF